MNTTIIESELIEQLRAYGIAPWATRDGLALGFRCPYCDADFLASHESFYAWHCDHIIPLSRGGDGSEDNVISCCRTCNALKHKYVPVGGNRADRLADARRYIRQQRDKHEARIAAVRSLIPIKRAPTREQIA